MQSKTARKITILTRDQWLNKCAERLREVIRMEPGEAAAYAIMLHDQQVSDNGRDPAGWDDPVEAADLEASCIADDGDDHG